MLKQSIQNMVQQYSRYSVTTFTYWVVFRTNQIIKIRVFSSH